MEAIYFFGRDKFVAGVGFIIGVIGLLINTFQVLMSKYLWEGIGIWCFVLFIIYIYLNERK